MRFGKHGIREFVEFLEKCQMGKVKVKDLLIITPFYTHEAANKILIELAKNGVTINVLIQKEQWESKEESASINQNLLIDLGKENANTVQIKHIFRLHMKLFRASLVDGTNITWAGSANFTHRADGTVIKYWNEKSRKYLPAHPNIEFITQILLNSDDLKHINQMWNEAKRIDFHA